MEELLKDRGTRRRVVDDSGKDVNKWLHTVIGVGEGMCEISRIAGMFNGMGYMI
jgi:hypothetical protein